MNDRIRGLSLDKVAFLDIETASKFKKLDPKSEMFKVFQYKQRDRVTEELPDQKTTLALYDKIAALSPVYGQVVCVTLAYVKDGKVNMKTFFGEEKQALQEALKAAEQMGRMLVGFNTNGFDLPFMRNRAVTLGLKYPEMFNDVGVKPWLFDGVSLDLCKQFQGASPTRLSFEEVCLMMGVPSPKNGDVKGSEVSKAFHQGRIQEIVEYCERDVIALINVFLKCQGKDLLTEAQMPN